MQKVKTIYSTVTNLGKYNKEVAVQQQRRLAQEQTLVKDMPREMFELTKKDEAGCCLNYALSMLYLLHEEDMEAYLVATPEENPATGERTHMHASVAYVLKGKVYFADPVKTVMGEEGDFSQISLEDFQKTMLCHGEAVKLFDCYGKDGEKLFFGEFMQTPYKEFRKEGA